MLSHPLEVRTPVRPQSQEKQIFSSNKVYLWTKLSQRETWPGEQRSRPAGSETKNVVLQELKIIPKNTKGQGLLTKHV